MAVAETGAHRLTRLWLTGPRAGRHDTLAGNLPGFPDNLSRGADGTIWTALAAPRQAPLEWLHRAPAGVRRRAGAAATRLRPPARRGVRILGIDPAGRITHDIGRPHARYRMPTSVCEHRGRLILGSLVEQAIAVCDLPPRPR